MTLATLTGCSGTSSCGDASIDLRACAKAAPPTATGEALPSFSEGVGMSEWLMYRGNDVRALSYSRDASEASNNPETRIDALEVEECAPLNRAATITHRGWSLADANGDRLGKLAGKLVSGQLTEDPPQEVMAGHCVKTVLAVVVPRGAKAAAAHDGPVATWVLPSD
jgi:hypothetical protein